MIALIQRVSSAHVTIDQQVISAIDAGLLVLLGVQKNDTLSCAVKLAKRVLEYRVFEDVEGKMNLSVMDSKGELLVVPQFTLAAQTQKGTRPGFSTAAPPQLGLELFQQFVAQLETDYYTPVATGVFGADMQVSLVNNGPVTFWLECAPPPSKPPPLNS